MRDYTPGFILVFILALISSWLGSLFPLIGGPVFGILLGIVINNTTGKPASTVKGVVFSSKKVLEWAIIALGCGLSLSSVWKTGTESFAVMIASLLAAFTAALVFGRLLNISNPLQLLIGAGTGICGGSAIAAVSPIIEADEAEVAYSMSAIFLFNVMAVLLFPALGHLMGLSDKAFGLWAGTAINDTSSVIAAGYLYSESAGDYAAIVKMVRSTMIIPVTFILAVLIGMRKKRGAGEREGAAYPLSQIFPWFILWFLAASLMNTLGIFSKDLLTYLGIAAKFMIVMALTGIGLSADLHKMVKMGGRPVIFGLIVWFFVASVSLLVQWVSGTL